MLRGGHSRPPRQGGLTPAVRRLSQRHYRLLALLARLTTAANSGSVAGAQFLRRGQIFGPGLASVGRSLGVSALVSARKSDRSSPCLH